MTKLRWSLAPKHHDRWELVDPNVMEMQANVEKRGHYVLARTCVWPGTDGRFFDVGDIIWLTSIDEAKRWCEVSLDLPVCEDA